MPKLSGYSVYPEAINNIILQRLEKLQVKKMPASAKARALSDLFKLLKQEGLNLEKGFIVTDSIEMLRHRAPLYKILEVSNILQQDVNRGGEFKHPLETVLDASNKKFFQNLAQQKQSEANILSNQQVSSTSDFPKDRAMEALCSIKSLQTMSLVLRSTFNETTNRLEQIYGYGRMLRYLASSRKRVIAVNKTPRGLLHSMTTTINSLLIWIKEVDY